MKKHILLLVLLISSFVTFAQTPKVATTNANLREQPNGAVVCVVPKGAVLSAGETENGWTRVTYGTKVGYIKSGLLHVSGPQEAKIVESPNNATVKHYTNSAGQRIQSPTNYNSPPQGATAECNDGTYSFSANHRGTCSHHGGVKRWLD